MEISALIRENVKTHTHEKVQAKKACETILCRCLHILTHHQSSQQIVINNIIILFAVLQQK